MKRILILITLITLSIIAFSQGSVKIEPLFKLGVYTTREVLILDSSPIPTNYFYHTIDKNIDYNITSGFRINYFNFYLESENTFFIGTDDFTSNYPYAAHFFIRTYYKNKKIKIGYEHLCIHPLSSDIKITYNVLGGHNEFYISYNL